MATGGENCIIQRSSKNLSSDLTNKQQNKLKQKNIFRRTVHNAKVQLWPLKSKVVEEWDISRKWS